MKRRTISANSAEDVPVSSGGYAPRSSRLLIDFAKQHNIPESVLLELGVLRKSEKDGRLYAFFRERIMIPIRDRFSRIIGYTARYIGDSPDTAKYLNSATSLIYSKESSIFGIHIALRTAAKENKFYLVEGAPDVLRLQLIGANNVIASLSSAWTERQLSQIKRYSSNLCFLPDADPPRQETLGALQADCQRRGSDHREGQRLRHQAVRQDLRHRPGDVFRLRPAQRGLRCQP